MVPRPMRETSRSLSLMCFTVAAPLLGCPGDTRHRTPGAALFVSSSRVNPRGAWRSGADEHLQRFAIGHGAVAVGHVLEADGAVEHLARLERAVEHVGQQLLDVG